MGTSCERVCQITKLRQRDLPIIDTRLTHHLYVPYAPLPLSIAVLRVFVLTRVVLLLWKGRICFECAPTDHSPPVSLLSFILPYKAVWHTFFLSFVLSHW